MELFAFMTYGAAFVRSKALALVFISISAAAQAEPVEIVALGDSLTQGYGLAVDDGFVPQLGAWLSANGYDATVVNAGVSGDTTAGGLSRVDWSIGPKTEAMIVALGGNDLLRGLSPEQARANLTGILNAAQARDIDVLLIGLFAPGNYGPDYKVAFDAIYPELAADFDTLYVPEFFQGLRSNGESASDIQPFMQADGIHPNAQGVQKIVQSLGPAVAELIDRTQND